MTSLIISAEGSVLHAWLKPGSRAAGQPSSRAAERDNSPRSSFLLEFTVLVFPAVYHAIRSGTSPFSTARGNTVPGDVTN